MSTITDACNRIISVLQQYFPDSAASFNSGLSRKEIDEISAELSFPLPEEVYELYQWRNGMEFNPYPYRPYRHFLPYYCLLPLETVVDIYKNRCDFSDIISEQLENGWNPSWLPITIHPEEGILFHGVLLSEVTKPSIYIDLQATEPGVPYLPTVQYPSLTNMLLACADRWEQKEYFFESIEGFDFTKKTIEIQNKYGYLGDEDFAT